MKRNRVPFLKQKPILYFDENFPVPVLTAFRRGSRWNCGRDQYTLVTFDEDFNNDAAYPFLSECSGGGERVRSRSWRREWDLNPAVGFVLNYAGSEIRIIGSGPVQAQSF